jgi:hypothetical protein
MSTVTDSSSSAADLSGAGRIQGFDLSSKLTLTDVSGSSPSIVFNASGECPGVTVIDAPSRLFWQSVTTTSCVTSLGPIPEDIMKLVKEHPDLYSAKLEWSYTASGEDENHLLYVATSQECSIGAKGLELYFPVEEIDLHPVKYDSLSAQPSLSMCPAQLIICDKGNVESGLHFQWKNELGDPLHFASALDIQQVLEQLIVRPASEQNKVLLPLAMEYRPLVLHKQVYPKYESSKRKFDTMDNAALCALPLQASSALVGRILGLS